MTNSAASSRTLTGVTGSPGYFAFKYFDYFRPEAVVDVLRGSSAGVLFKRVVPRATCAALTQRFWSSAYRRQRAAEAPGYYLGSYHYHKTTAGYLDDAAASAGPLDEVLDVPDDPLGTFYSGLRDVLAVTEAKVRRATHDGRQASRAIMRSWHGDGAFALAPHEDLGQCTEPQQADFEIQRVTQNHVVALNICLENGGGGRLVQWNIRPDAASRERLGLSTTGTPYPIETLAGIENQKIDIQAGDVYVFNGAHVHAVEPCLDPSQRRTTLSGILGFIDASTVVTWT